MPDFQGPDRSAVPQVTTAASREQLRAAIEPYADSPTPDLPPGAIGCRFCGNTRFRRSNFRPSDLGEFLLFRYPVRCMRCNQRMYSYFLTAALAYPPKAYGGMVARGTDTWQAWTRSHQQEAEASPVSLPAGTRATRLAASQAEPVARGLGRKTPDDRQIW